MSIMKKFTCREMGGPCDFVIEGNTIEEVAQKGADHVKLMSDHEHQKIAESMKSESKEEIEKWFAWFKGVWDQKV